MANNPIVERLHQLTDQWIDFAELPEARVLCWQVESDEHAMIDAFLAVEDDDRAGQTLDLFVPLQAAFKAGRYGEALLAEFTAKAAALYDGLADPATPAWTPPPIAPHAPDPVSFLRATQSFTEHYQLPGLLALVLTPAEVDDPAAFRQWLDLLVRTALPKLTKLRIVLKVDRKDPALAALVQAHPTRVVAIPADLDMPAAREEISEEAGNLDKPGGQYRHQFVQTTNALGKGDLDVADGHATAALDICKGQGWFALAVPIHLAMGASFAAAGNTAEANRRYAGAEAVAADGEKAGDPVCAKLRVQARMCRGGLLIHAGAWAMAASLFGETAPLARATGDAGMTIDCFRLASFCHELDKQIQPAWQQGVDGLAFARTVDRQTLPMTTLNYLGVGLERLCKQGSLRGSWPRIEQELVALLGPEWRPAAPTKQSTKQATP
jgi:hypothetical protein